MEMRTNSIFFPRARGSGPRTANALPMVFPRQVLQAAAGITGYTAQFLDSDHHLGDLDVRVTPVVSGNTVTVTGRFGLRDWSGDWDDDYAGTINFVVLAELESAAAPPPRRDLQIVDAEFNQVIQHFRSNQFLDPVTTRPDNSIPLIEAKPTGVRLYVDHDDAAGLPPFASLSGEMEVISPVGTRVLAPRRAIPPRRDGTILRAERDHTLNFLIPEELCTGTVTVRARAFPAGNPASRSGLFERTIRFVAVPSLRVHLVGVRYTGQGLDLAAPDEAAMTQTLGLTERMWPTGEVRITGWQSMNYDRDMAADIANGCGDGFSGLLDRLQDMRGNSDDLYHAELPAGVDTGGVGGCGRRGVAASMNGSAGVAVHELAHAMGRPHSPCDTTSCPTQPRNTDADYPNYGPFARGSIGDFGYDPLNDRVFDPATTFDFMTYASPQWMSPYSYARLMTATGGTWVEGGAAPAARMMAAYGAAAGREPERAAGKPPAAIGDIVLKQRPHLDLRLDIARDHAVTRHHGFRFDMAGTGGCGHDTDYAAELLDKAGRALVCVPLTCSCNLCRPNCYPMQLRERVPMPDGAALLRVWEGRDRLIYEEAIPEPPALRWTERSETRDGVWIGWEADDAPNGDGDGKADEWGEKETWREKDDRGGGAGDQALPDLMFVAQYEDAPGVWRGIAPRTSERRLLVPAALLKRGGLRVRVIGSSGLASAMIEDRLPPPRRDEAPPKPPVVVAGGGVVAAGGALGDWVRAVGGGGKLAWYDADGAELSGSATLDLRQLADGRHTLRAVELGGRDLQSARSVLVEKSAAGVVLLRDHTQAAADAARDDARDEGGDAAPASPNC